MDFVSLFFTPDRDDLRHDAGEVGIHQLPPQGLGGAFRDKIQYANAQLSHAVPSWVRIVHMEHSGWPTATVKPLV
jgi:hypothetical protein